MNNRYVPALLALVLGIGLAACEREGPLERAGEEVDEAVDTMRNGGEESTENKLDDAADQIREGVNETADEIKE